MKKDDCNQLQNDYCHVDMVQCGQMDLELGNTITSVGSTGDWIGIREGTANPYWQPHQPYYPYQPYPYTPVMPQRVGWVCPKCNAGVSPDQASCPCGTAPTTPTWTITCGSA